LTGASAASMMLSRRGMRDAHLGIMRCGDDDE
jgi:hypothetical protein